MNTKFQSKKTKFLKLIILSILLIVFILPISSFAADRGLNWSNPNQNGGGPFQFKPKDALNSQLIMQVVGCSGVVDKVAGAINKFAKDSANKLYKETVGPLVNNVKVEMCRLSRKALIAAASTVPNLNLTDNARAIECHETSLTKDLLTIEKLDEQITKETAQKKREECFNGIAITLARNQLTSMTRATMNWVNSGFEGDPMYARNIGKLTNSIERSIVEKGINKIGGSDFGNPYGQDFSRSYISNYKTNHLKNGLDGFLSSMTSNLGDFVTDSNSYNNKSLNRAKEAQRVNDIFYDDFGAGGWNAWLALTQMEKNNPLGSEIKFTEYLARESAKKIEENKQELLQNNGFLSQKRCIKRDNELDLKILDTQKKYAEASLEEINICDKATTDDNKMDCEIAVMDTQKLLATLNSLKKQNQVDALGKGCLEWEVVTPGTLIKDQLSNYINSPVRQLELVRTINDSLNSLFGALISRFQNQGLSSLSSEKYEYVSTDMGVGDGSNSSLDFSSAASDPNGYKNSSFDLTRDLGNQFIHGYRKIPIGSWDAKNNLPELSIGLPPINADGDPWEANVYYIVKTAGKTKLFENGLNDWKEGDRAFWDGNNWQNWQKSFFDKKTQLMANTSPIAKRGVLQIQKDYIVASKEILMNLPRIMPKLGELDYCIPGPNPIWTANSRNTSVLFSEYMGSINAEFKKGSLLKRKSNTYTIARAGDQAYDDYYDIFKYTDYKYWNSVKSTYYWIKTNTYGSLGKVKGKQEKLDSVQKMIDNFIERANLDIKIFFDSYGSYIENLYGPSSPMQTQFILREDRSLDISKDKNPKWLPMVSEALDITKAIVDYNDEIIETADVYKDSIIKSNSNIAKLQEIKIAVSNIIRKAQDTRNKKLLSVLEAESKLKGTKILTEAQYKEKYKGCLAEEQIVFYDDLDIIGNMNEEDRCFDNMDNDLDGLIDELDPDCGQFVAVSEIPSVCIVDMTESFIMTDEDGQSYEFPFRDDNDLDPVPSNTEYCNNRTAANCKSSLYYSDGIAMNCTLAGN